MNTTTVIGVPWSWARNLSINESINSGGANGSRDQVLEPATVRIFRLAIQTFLFVTGVLGNVLVCIVSSRKRNLKIVGNRFILHLAVADLGILLISFPLLVIRIEFQDSWPFGDIICRTAYPFTDIFYGVEIGCITAIAMHRYRMLVHCMKPQMSVRTAGYVVALIWAASFAVIVVPLFFAMQLVTRSGVLHSLECFPVWPKPIMEQIYVIVNVILLYVIPLVIILVTYLRIRAKLKESIEIHNSYRLKSCTGSLQRHNEILARIAQNERAMKLLTPVVVIFALTMFPLNLYRLLAPFIPSIREYEYMAFIFRFFVLLLVANSMANPVVYSVVNTEFRREFVLLLRCRRCRPCCRTPTSGLKTTTSATKSTGIRRSSSSRRSSSNSQLRKWSISKSATASSWPWKRGSLSTASSALSGSADSKRKRKQRKEKVKLVVL